jgi:hypothetical protein
MGYYEDLKRANNGHTTIVTATFVVVIILGAIKLGMTDKQESHFKNVTQFSVHAYQSNAPGSITLAGPFLGKVRVTKDPNAHALNDSKLTTYKLQGACDAISDLEVRGKCQIMRTPPMYLGKIHSSWSVLGAQSITTIVKHIFWIVLAFAIFTLSELWMRNGYCKDTWRRMRLVVVGLAIIFFVIDFVWDFGVPDMHAVKDNRDSINAVGSVTTGASIWLVCLLIICFSHLDEPVIVQEAGAVGVEGKFIADLTQSANYVTYFAETANYKRFEAQLHLNVNTSFLLLLLLPLFALLSLTSFGRSVVDVHVQLVFFSYIFFAVLDVVQSRVVSVLASLSPGNSLASGIGFIKAFVVLAFVLCKFFVFFPTWQLMGLYYAPQAMSVPSWLHIFEIVLVLALSVFDLAYCSGLLMMFYDMTYKSKALAKDATTHTTAQIEDHAIAGIEAHAYYRSAVLCVYLLGSFITLVCMQTTN